VVVSATVSLFTALAVPVDATEPAAAIASVAVSFSVRNVNSSRVSCPTTPDGQTYTIAGSLVAPLAALAPGSNPVVTLFLHGAGGDLFRFDAVAGYDFALEMARLGHATVVVDRLGYGASGYPNGFAACFGSQADIAHQIVEQLRAGTYQRADHRPPLSFSGVAIGGHGPGAMVAEIVAYSFGGVDALVDMAWSDQGFSAQAGAQAASTAQVCQAGGEPKYGPQGPPGYALFPTTDDAFERLFFSSSADPPVVQAVTAARERDPCGDLASLSAAVDADNANLASVNVPVLLIFGDADAVFPPLAEDAQRAKLSGSQDVSAVLVAGTGHGLYLEQHAPAVRGAVSGWLDRHAF
jgi:pimeloyl-ACP methyl ester carboxylesterase